jgi:16S rRNA (guanine527-N7)-methyltransferase
VTEPAGASVPRGTEPVPQRYRQFEGLAEYAEILATRGLDRGLLGPRELPRLWSRHLSNCAIVAEEGLDLLPIGARAVDIGSGAGLPGIVWALVRPDLRLTLLEPLLRRFNFLGEVVSELGLEGRVSVVRARAEGLQETFDVVTSRAVAPLPRLAEWSLPLCRLGGSVVALKGDGVQAEIDAAAVVVRRLGGSQPVVSRFGENVLAEPTSVVVFRRLR